MADSRWLLLALLGANLEDSLLSAFRLWTPRQWFAATAATGISLIVLGVPTVLIPNSFFTREIPPTVWSYPVWIITSVLMGLLIATYAKPFRGMYDMMADDERAAGDKGSRFGVLVGAIACFATGCPAGNTIVLVLLGASGALTWFAPSQPLVTALALVLTTEALVVRLRGQVSCPSPARKQEEVHV